LDRYKAEKTTRRGRGFCVRAGESEINVAGSGGKVRRKKTEKGQIGGRKVEREEDLPYHSSKGKKKSIRKIRRKFWEQT